MHKLIEYVCDELESLEKKADKGNGLSMSEIEYADKLAHLKKNLLKGDELMDEMDGEYSGNMGASYAREGGNRGTMYNRGGSYARGDGRGRGRNARRDSRGRYSSERGYSRADETEDMIETIRDMMGELPQEVRRDAEKFVNKLEQTMM